VSAGTAMPAPVTRRRQRAARARAAGAKTANRGPQRATDAPTDRAPVLLASEGRAIPASAIAQAAELAGAGGQVHVLSITRVHGVAFGLPNPGLLPTRAEWEAQREIVAKAVKAVKRRGVDAEGHVYGTRKATKRICDEAKRLGCAAIVMSADPPRSRAIASLLWSQEPYRVQRRSKLPVHLVVEEP
jgi:nucleotide-binding universal stress UspA family protein